MTSTPEEVLRPVADPSLRTLPLPPPPAPSALGDAAARHIAPRSGHMYVSILVAWLSCIAWFHPRLVGIMDIAAGPVTTAALGFFVVFTEIAWLYGLYNIAVIVFAWVDRRLPAREKPTARRRGGIETPVAILYTTCNDFVEFSALSCVKQDYPLFRVYILDDSSDPLYRRRIDRFAAAHPGRVQVVRRPQRKGFKAGNLNYALGHVVEEALFAIADADEILPRDFLSTLVPRLEGDPNCGFIQANHAANPSATSALEQDMGIGVDIHWKWYQPLRNRFGFVMFLGHGALLRTRCWKRSGGFPELVSEDLAYALTIREQGYYGTFAEDVVCYEDFPSTVRSFRVRHVKWTRGTCEFLCHRLLPLLRSRRISLTEKIDVLVPTLNLPLTLCYFAFMVNAGLFLPLALGESVPLTLAVAGTEVVVPTLRLPPQMVAMFTWDFYAITVVTILAPVLCFLIEMWRTPLRLFRFLCHSTALYAALSPLSSLCVLGYLATGKARFLVTGERAGAPVAAQSGARPRGLAAAYKFLCETHPDHRGVWGWEVLWALVFAAAAVAGFHLSFLGISLAFLTLPVMHFSGWESAFARTMVWLPFSLVLGGLALGGLGVLGMAPVLFGYGFHF